MSSVSPTPPGDAPQRATPLLLKVRDPTLPHRSGASTQGFAYELAMNRNLTGCIGHCCFSLCPKICHYVLLCCVLNLDSAPEENRSSWGRRELEVAPGDSEDWVAPFVKTHQAPDFKLKHTHTACHHQLKVEDGNHADSGRALRASGTCPHSSYSCGEMKGRKHGSKLWEGATRRRQQLIFLFCVLGQMLFQTHCLHEPFASPQRTCGSSHRSAHLRG